MFRAVAARDRLWALAAGIFVALLLCLPMWLMSSYRAFYARHMPDFAASWPSNGKFSWLGYPDAMGGKADEDIYAARSREFARNIIGFDPFVPERRSYRLLVSDPLPFAFVGLLFRLTRDIDQTWMICRLLCSTLWFWLLFDFFRGAQNDNASDSGDRRGSRAAALTIAFIMVVYYDLLIAIFSTLNVVQVLKHVTRVLFWFIGGEVGILGPTLITSKMVSWVPYWLTWWLAPRAARRMTWASWTLLGAAAASCMYSHLDVGSVAVGATCFYAAVLCVRASRIVWPACWGALVALMLTMPWVAAQFPPDWWLIRHIATLTRRPEPWSFVFLAIAVFSYRWCRSRPAALWACAGLLASFVTLNIQILTGYCVIPGYWQFQGLVCSQALAFLYLQERWRSSSVWGYVFVAASFMTIGRATTYAALHYQYVGLPRDVEGGLDWLTANAAPGERVVTLSGAVASLLASRTEFRPLIYFTHPLVSDIQPLESARRVLFVASHYGLTPELVNERAYNCKTMEKDVAEAKHDQWIGKQDHLRHDRLSMSSYFFDGYPCGAVRGFILQAAREKPRTIYPAHYLWVGPFERDLAGSSLKLNASAHKVYQNATVTLYRLGPQNTENTHASSQPQPTR